MIYVPDRKDPSLLTQADLNDLNLKFSKNQSELLRFVAVTKNYKNTFYMKEIYFIDMIIHRS